MRLIGVDPDAEKHGIAIYQDGKLVSLGMWDIGEWLNQLSGTKIDFVSMENVQATNTIYARNRRDSKAVQSKIAMSVGRNQQAQRELMRVLEYYEVPYMLIEPSSGNWADNKAFFEKVTGWKQSSNHDNRSAAYFGFLAVKHYKPMRKK